MKKIFLSAFFIIAFMFSCDEDKKTIPACDVDNPLEELPWLKTMTGSMTQCAIEVSIFQATYSESTVFYSQITDPAANSVFQITLWDCNGNIVKDYKFGEQALFAQEVTNSSNIFTCSK